MKSARQPAVRPERVVGCRKRQGIHCSVAVFGTWYWVKKR